MTLQTIFIYWTERPPTTNNLYLNVYRKGRIVAPAYRTWQNNCHPTTMTLPESPIADRFSLHYYLVKPDNRKRDLANFEKALTDSLVKHRIIKDDSQMNKLVMQWCKAGTKQDWTVKGVLQWISN